MQVKNRAPDNPGRLSIKPTCPGERDILLRAFRVTDLRRPPKMSPRRVRARAAQGSATPRPSGPTHTSSRRVAEFVIARREFLPPDERALVEQVFVQGRTLSYLATLTATTPRHMRWHIWKLVERVLAPTFDAVVFGSAGWPPQMVAIGAAVYIRGRKVREAASECGVPYRAALVQAKAIKALAAAAVISRKNRGEAA